MYIDELKNNPLTGVGVEKMVTELQEFYGWELLYAALGLKSFGVNPSIKSAVKFLRKAEWARRKVEVFYLYRFKQMPRPTGCQFHLPPRERGFGDDVHPKEPLKLTFEKIAQLKADAEEEYHTRVAARRAQRYRD